MPGPRIYLAGPEVFLPDPMAAGRAKCALAAEHGLEGVYPLDPTLPIAGKPKRAAATMIYTHLEDLMRTCDAVIANLTPFRGVSADAGTAFELGFMRALGRPVLGYTNSTLDLVARSRTWRAMPRLPFDCDHADADIEDLGGAENLMLEVAIEASGSRLHRHQAAPGDMMTDLTAFRLCLADARRLLPG